MTIFAKPGVFVHNADFADPVAFAAKCVRGKIAWVAIYAHEGATEYGQNAGWLATHDWIAPLRAAGIRVGLWGYLKDDPAAEAKLASDLIGKYDDAARSLFYIANAEAEYTSWGGDFQRSRAFVKAFRALRPTRTAALSSYGAAVWDNLLGTVFDYVPWINGVVGVSYSQFEFLPQAYFQDAPEYEPRHCVAQALANGWPLHSVHPTVGVYTGARGFRLTGADWAYLLRDAASTGWSVFNAENMTEEDFDALALVA